MCPATPCCVWAPPPASRAPAATYVFTINGEDVVGSIKDLRAEQKLYNAVDAGVNYHRECCDAPQRWQWQHSRPATCDYAQHHQHSPHMGMCQCPAPPAHQQPCLAPVMWALLIAHMCWHVACRWEAGQQAQEHEGGLGACRITNARGGQGRGGVSGTRARARRGCVACATMPRSARCPAP
jgi:hypothetical protein